MCRLALLALGVVAAGIPPAVKGGIVPSGAARITNIDPWPRGYLANTYRRADRAWDRIKVAATAAQGRPSWDD